MATLDCAERASEIKQRSQTLPWRLKGQVSRYQLSTGYSRFRSQLNRHTFETGATGTVRLFARDDALMQAENWAFSILQNDYSLYLILHAIPFFV